jgi:hypothetical protein
MHVQALRREMRTQIDIDAPPESVWSVLTAFKAYGEWNPAIIAVSGDVRVGSRLTLRFQPPGARGYTFRPRLLVVDRLRELRWAGWPRMPFVFETEHYFAIDPQDERRSRLQHGLLRTASGRRSRPGGSTGSRRSTSNT